MQSVKVKMQNKEDIELAVKLTILIKKNHLLKLINNRVDKNTKHCQHQKFVDSNLLQTFSVFVLQQHAENLKLITLALKDLNAHALKNLCNSFITQNLASSTEGCYLLCDRVKNKQIRSGKCAGRPIQKQMKEHKNYYKLK